MYYNYKLAVDTPTDPMFNSPFGDETLNVSIYIFLGLFASILLFLFIKKLYFHFRYGKRYFIFPKVGVKGIASISMVIAIAIAIILLLSIISSGIMGAVFRIYPSVRILVESILITIGGLLFGPIVGVFVAAITDLLSVLLSAGMFHYAFFVIALWYGLLAGSVKSIINISKNSQFKFTLLSIIGIAAVAVCNIMMVYYTKTDSFGGTIIGIDIFLPKTVFIWILLVFYASIILVLIVLICFINVRRISYFSIKTQYLFRYYIRFSYYKHKLMHSKNPDKVAYREMIWANKKSKQKQYFGEQMVLRRSRVVNHVPKWYNFFAPTLVVSTITQGFINICLMPTCSAQFGGGLSFEYWTALGIVELPIMFLLSLLIVFPVYAVVAKNFDYDYRTNIVEPLSKKLISD